VVGHRSLDNITDIYNETPERAACQLGRLVDTPNAQAVFLSGTGMLTITSHRSENRTIACYSSAHAVEKRKKKQFPVNRGE